MEKYSQFRDRGSGIAPFFPIPPAPMGFHLPLRILLFCVRLPLFIFVCLAYFLVLQWLPIGSLGKKASLWCILGIPSIWWVDLQIDGVKRGSLSKQHQARLPRPGSIIASSFTSPIDPVYLAAIFDPVFTVSYPSSRQVEHVSLFRAILRAFAKPLVNPPANARMVDVSTLLKNYPNRPLVMFPECTTTNGRGILPLSRSIVSVPPSTKIFPLSLRYTPVDVVTPLPGTYLSFFWTLLSGPTHCIRVRIAEYVSVRSATVPCDMDGSGVLSARQSINVELAEVNNGANEPDLTPAEKAVLDYVGESLARLGRVKRVGLGVKEKQDFLRLWTKTRQTW